MDTHDHLTTCVTKSGGSRLPKPPRLTPMSLEKWHKDGGVRENAVFSLATALPLILLVFGLETPLDIDLSVTQLIPCV